MCIDGTGCSGLSSQKIACNEHDCYGKALKTISNVFKRFYIIKEKVNHNLTI